MKTTTKHKQNNKKIRVSDNFVKAYRLFNIINIREIFNSLTRSEKILLYILIVESHEDFNESCLENFKLDETLLDLLHNLLTDDESILKDPDLLYLTNLTKFQYIDVSQLSDSRGRTLPKPITNKDEIFSIRRDLGIEKILID